MKSILADWIIYENIDLEILNQTIINILDLYPP